jgi:hypothetical protein
MESIFIFFRQDLRDFFACGERPFDRKTDDFQCILQVLFCQLCECLRRGTDNYLDVVLEKLSIAFR